LATLSRLSTMSSTINTRIFPDPAIGVAPCSRFSRDPGQFS
jgi:hypothetical protein